MSTNGIHPTNNSTDYVENGRTYHGYRRGMYMYPCDEAEKDRMDMSHQLFLVARQELHRAKIDKFSSDTRILDLGTGTGIWAIDIADTYPRADVFGVDLTNIQPTKIPRNLRFRVPWDYESASWSLGEESFDLIHIRQACGSVSSWPEIYQKIFLHLKPGQGCIEQVEVDLQPRCDDGTLPYYPMMLWYERLKEATAQRYRPIEYQHSTRQMLEQTGFTDIHEQVIKAPFNSWSKDPHLREIGRWHCVSLSDGIEALSLAPFTRVFQWSPDAVQRFVNDVKQVVMTRKIHAYNNIHVWTARRPMQ